MEGKIILINPAAKKLLSISPEDSTFEDVFGKFKLNINMEKIIYLENWTSTEERIEVEENNIVEQEDYTEDFSEDFEAEAF